MKAGDTFNCPHCGENTFVKKESLTEGWSKTGEVLLCASCNATIEKLDHRQKISSTKDSTKKPASLDALANLLDTEQEEKLTIECSDDEGNFCRNCESFVSHPFMDRCSLHDKDIHPMDDCNDFTEKKEEK